MLSKTTEEDIKNGKALKGRKGKIKQKKKKKDGGRIRQEHRNKMHCMICVEWKQERITQIERHGGEISGEKKFD